MYVGIEAGGTKFLVAAGTGPDDLSSPVRIQTTDPATTLAETVVAIRDMVGDGSVSALGIATFGPVDLRPSSGSYGHLIGTPKAGWDGVDMLSPFRDALDVPIGLDTDVNGAALGEQRWGAGVGRDPVVYITVGTGIGGGAIVNGAPLHGILHPELGHAIVRRHPDDDFPGSCPFHRDCVEGLASGPAVAARWGRPATDLDGDDSVLRIQSWYLAQLVTDVVLFLSPQRIILGGGVMQLEGLLASVQQEVRRLLAGYIPAREIIETVDEYLVSPGLGHLSGVLGAIALAELAESPA